MSKVLEFLSILVALVVASLFTYWAVHSFRMGDDVRFAVATPLAAWSIWKWVKVGEE